MFILSSDIFSHLLLSSIYLTFTSFPFSLSGHPSSSFSFREENIGGRKYVFDAAPYLIALEYYVAEWVGKGGVVDSDGAALTNVS